MKKVMFHTVCNGRSSIYNAELVDGDCIGAFTRSFNGTGRVGLVGARLPL